MDLNSTLPDRCVACNEPAQSYRVSRTLYCSPLAWKIAAFAAPFVAMFLGILLNLEFLMIAFWPLALVLLIANAFVRKSFELQLGLCPRHRRVRAALIGLSFLAIVGVATGIFTFRSFGPATLLLSILALIGLSIAQAFVGASGVRLKELDEEHAWLSGTSAAFRNVLPELQ